ncbi:signal peptidase II [Mastigocoleus sp. MO_188.B34]|uniref:signal peptidase II n=1 Tax=Mastigocoleus sp. MO_188.B34 TaxID=3036635 RepID=UPI00260C4B38|nr:signal peptidase II [Mastigocoleus sp. MO_188.B34]MDJ0695104.1 signal peptidase II [Mastigocoleus sp. MO_188.B34]
MSFKNRFFWIAALSMLVLDQLTKFWVQQDFSLKQTQALIPGVFHFTYVHNYGAAWSLFSGHVGWLRWLSLIVSVGLIAFAIFSPTLNRWEQFGYGFILGGAVGNGIDRFMLGYVIDFLHFKLINFPVFNIADVSINIGLACLLISYFQKKPDSNQHKLR